VIGRSRIYTIFWAKEVSETSKSFIGKRGGKGKEWKNDVHKRIREGVVLFGIVDSFFFFLEAVRNGN
jgi:hypothetical protein